MKLNKMILMFLLYCMNLFRFLMPMRKNRITFISLSMDHLEGDFYQIDKKLKEAGDFDIRYNLMIYKKSLSGDFLYLLNCLRQLYEINTSRLVFINDNNYVITKLKRDSTKVVQIWHACGAVKKFGNQIPRSYKIANYDYVVCASDIWKSSYAEAFGVNEEQVIVTGLPRTDALCDPKKVQSYRDKFFKKYPHLKGKYLILYAPTFRGNTIKGLNYVELDMNRVIDQLDDQSYFLYKMHPLLADVGFGEHERLVNVNKENLYMLMCACDCLISDYSSIIFDYSLLKKKMLIFASDYEDYRKTIGFNVDYMKEMPCPICKKTEELIECLKNKEETYIKETALFQKKYMPYEDGKNVDRIIDLVMPFISEQS